MGERTGPPTLWYLGNLDGPQCRLQDNTRPRGRKNRPAFGGRRCLGLARQTNLTSLPDSSHFRYSAIGGLIHGGYRKTGSDHRRPRSTSGHRSRSRGIRDPDSMRQAAERMDRMREEMRARVGNVNLAVPLIRETRDEECNTSSTRTWP